MKHIITSIILLNCYLLHAQKTYVPDNNFEQALIDFGYDDVKKAEFGDWQDPVSDKPSLGKRLLGKYYDPEAQDIAPKVRKSFLEGKYYDPEAQDIAGKVRKSMGKDEKPVEEEVKTEVKPPVKKPSSHI